MACAPPHLSTFTCEPAAEPGHDSEPQPDSSPPLDTRSQVCLQGSQQQQNADPESSEPPGLPSAAQTDSTAATPADRPAKPLSDANKAPGNGDDAADIDAGVNSSSSSSCRSGQHVSGDKHQSNAAAANEASFSSSNHHPRDKLHSSTATARGNSCTTAGAAARVHQPIRVMQQAHQQKQSELSSISQQTGSQHIKQSQAFQQTGSQSTESSKVTQQSSSQQNEPRQAIQQAWQKQNEHQAAILQAIEHWACRLEMSAAGKASKPRARRHLSRRQRAHIRHAMEQQNQIDDAAGQPFWMCSAGLQTGS